MNPTIFESPNHGTERPRTDGVVIHSTRGGLLAGHELISTAEWFISSRSRVSAHRVIGCHGEHWQFVSDDLIAWHARSSLNGTHLSVELEQGKPDDPFSDEQYLLAALVVREWSSHYGFVRDRSAIVGHDETEAGKLDGKTDPGPMWDWGRFTALLHEGPPWAAHAPATWELREAYENVLGVARFTEASRQSAARRVAVAQAELRHALAELQRTS